MPRKKRDPLIQFQILAALDEIEAAQGRLEAKRILKSEAKTMRGWIRQKKAELKELGYTGKIPRQQRTEGQVEYEPKPEKEHEYENAMQMPKSDTSNEGRVPILRAVRKGARAPSIKTRRRRKPRAS